MEPPYYLAAETPAVMAEGAWTLSAWMIHRWTEEDQDKTAELTSR